MKLLWSAALCLALGACGGGGGGSAGVAPAATGGPPPAAAAADPPVVHALVSGVAATGNGVAGRVYIKDAAGQEQFVDTSTGSFSFNADGMTPPFLLRVQVGSGGSAQTLYSFATAAGTANITPLTSLAVLGAAGSQSLDALYANPSAAGFAAVATALPAAVSSLKQSLAPLLAQFSVSGMDPIAGTFAADHTGMDALLDAITVSFAGGDAVVADKTSGATLLDAPTADLSHAMAVPAWTAQDAANASDPDLAVDATGNGLVVWSDSSSGSYPIRARFVTQAGSSAVTLNPSGQAMTPKAVFDGQGNATVVWAQYENNRNDVWARRYLAATGSWTPALRVSSNSAVASVGPPDLAVDGAGNAVATWHQGDGRNNHFDQWYSRFDAASGNWSAAALISDGVNSAYGGRVALNAIGRGVIVWQQEQGDGTTVSNGPTDVWARTINGAGGLNAAHMINSVPGGTTQVYGQLAIALDNAGTAAALWVQGGVQSAMLSAGGWQPSQALLSDASHVAYSPDVAFDGAGNAVAVWQEQDGTNAFIGASRYLAGSGWGTSILFSAAAPGDVYLPRVAMDGAGNATAVWYQAAVGGTAQLFSSRLRAGGSWGTARLTSGTTTDGFVTYPVPVVASNAAGQTLAVWGVNSN